VEAARNAGVDLAFLSANEVYWKTRWENAIDGSGTPYRTLVSYKETWANGKIDPDPAWTGTWRDPRFAAPSENVRPENALTGTIYTVDSYRLDTIDVPAAYGRMRFWRDTSVATLLPGQTATLTPNVLGYEWDEDLDNGHRPAGQINLSSTTMDVAQYVSNYGNTVAPGTATHNLTLHRAPSGALVFGAGTTRWSWGLDANHINEASAVDPRMQQATVNLFADMGAQPLTLQGGLKRAAPSSDAAAPVSRITTPGSGATARLGDTVTVSGTATDTGGVVAAVEVSTDGGTTWRRAVGRETWTYSWRPQAAGTWTVRSRAIDDSVNMEAPGAGVAVAVQEQPGQASIWSASSAPANPSINDGAAVELGVKFQAQKAGWITGIRFYKGAQNTGTHVGNLWTAAGAKLGTATFQNETASGWQTARFASPIQIQANTTYVASYHAPNGRYAADADYFASQGVTSSPLKALSSPESGGNGVYAYGATSRFPGSTWRGTNYWVDVMYTDSLTA
jgi:hypothetical protein